jgi:hypothetical protein
VRLLQEFSHERGIVKRSLTGWNLVEMDEEVGPEL